MGMIFRWALAAAIIATLSRIAMVAKADEPTRIRIAILSHRENGCSESTHPFKVVIPNPERLDRSYPGVLAGIERHYVEKNGTVSDSDWAFADNGSALTVTLFARGGGTRIKNPFNNGNVCVNASGANITIEIWAYYKNN